MMTRKNVYLKIMISFVLILLAIFAFNTNKVEAFSVEDIKAGNEVEEGLIDKIYQEGDNSILSGTYMLNFNSTKLINLLANDEKLNSLIQEDEYVYDNLYFKVSENTENVTVTYGNKETKDLEIVTIEDEQYAKCPIGIIKKENNEYYLGYIACDGFGNFGTDTLSGIIKMINKDETIEEISFMTELSEEDENAYGAMFSMRGTNEIGDGGAGTWYVSGVWFDKKDILKSEECYLQLVSAVSLGESVTIEPFGKFLFSEEKEEEEYYKYIYELKITDKSFFDKTYMGRILLPEYNVIHFYNLSFMDYSEENEAKEIESIDSKTKVKFESTTDIVPEETTLVAEKITAGVEFTGIAKILESEVSKFELYDISLINNDVKIQPNGNVKVSIPVPEGFDAEKIVVYYIADDGTKTKLDCEVKDGFVVFETNHFSNYVVAEEKVASAENTTSETSNKTSESKNTTKEDKDNNTTRKLDETPKTGEINTEKIVALVLCIISLVGLAMSKKN